MIELLKYLHKLALQIGYHRFISQELNKTQHFNIFVSR